MQLQQSFLYFLLTCAVSAQYMGRIDYEQDGGDIAVVDEKYGEVHAADIPKPEDGGYLNPVLVPSTEGTNNPSVKDKIGNIFRPALDLIQDVAYRVDEMFEDAEDELDRAESAIKQKEMKGKKNKHCPCKGRKANDKGSKVGDDASYLNDPEEKPKDRDHKKDFKHKKPCHKKKGHHKGPGSDDEVFPPPLPKKGHHEGPGSDDEFFPSPPPKKGHHEGPGSDDEFFPSPPPKKSKDAKMKHHKAKEEKKGPKTEDNEFDGTQRDILVLEAFGELMQNNAENIADEFASFLDALDIEYFGNMPVHIAKDVREENRKPKYEEESNWDLNDLTPEQFAYLEMLNAAGIDPKAAIQQPSSSPEFDYTKGSKEKEGAVFVEQENGEHVNMKAFPDHTLRIKKSNPESLGIDTVKQYTGYLDVDDDRHLFFWFFESRNDPVNDPIVLWLNGGPGCSSMTGLFMELGPSRINLTTLKPEYNPHSWNSNASVIFLDQPIGAGFSNGDGSVLDTITAGKDVYAFLSLFFAKFPQYSHLPFHITGESYAGHYIPQFAKEILEHNQGANDFVATGYEHQKSYINLKGVAIGNGLTDPLIQYYYYGKMACENSYGPIMPQEQCDRITNAYGTCSKLITACYQTGFTPICIGASLYCNNAMMGPFQQTGLNVYDIREKCHDPENMCYSETGAIEEYLNQEDVVEALGVEQGFKGCNMEVNLGFLFKGDWMRKTFREDVTAILEEGLPVLIYAGDADYICNHMGNEAWADALEWSGHREFYETDLAPWSPAGSEAGRGKTYKNFSYLRIYEAGHMVPFNQPEASLEMLNQWLNGNLQFSA
ncbi:vacuolar carboxypeptidase Y [Schizosaccharomyces cryophilus OY26]|uniref:Carboxypeptidase n=1 Tax=Schizosaccharomyces cryophilus (strain OY26 / ATCC MYA-4695 / CBS 11777 / NBRC 106824 / NRRL Y48691) TaxID=653667 RepID=S9X2Z0_SCHCR|nr:vacuolar carboxypeptidase Y [Schizosaccharomyces cryophilus OY26]EPY51462.1 vacuolar carboxypeptidase Y [Schizosaccharomyces cryophilus OY26]